MRARELTGRPARMTAYPPTGKFRRLLAAGVLLLLVTDQAGALTLAELLADQKLTPKRFAALFESFQFEFGTEVQEADQFLKTKRGDCDDYAVLADYVLSRHGFGTKLVHVRLVGRVAHAICYVNEDKAYLDYNNRTYFVNLQKSGSSLREIAEKISQEIEGNWTSASEFTYDYATNDKTVVRTVIKTSAPALDPDVVALKEKNTR
ncbi:MAG: hypothetical protein RL324_915 [Verrucomicrobiota bacterium]|jgi:hypothetical protein